MSSRFIHSQSRKKEPPIVLYPEECWYCGTCVDECPNIGAIKLIPLKMNKVSWKDKF